MTGECFAEQFHSAKKQKMINPTEPHLAIPPLSKQGKTSGNLFLLIGLE